MSEMMNMKNKEVVTMTSLEVVDLINKFREEEQEFVVYKEHKTFMRDIRNEIEYLKKAGIKAENNFVPGSYIDKNNQERPCYKLNKAGIMQMLNKESALVRYKTQQYIEVLEERLKQATKPLSAMELLKLQYKAIEEQDQKIEEVRKDLIDFKDNSPLFSVECDEISKSVRGLGVKVLGGKQSNAYKNSSIRGQVYSDIYDQIKRQFGVKSYKAIKRGQLQKALETIEQYKLPLFLKELIECNNNQLTFQ